MQGHKILQGKRITDVRIKSTGAGPYHSFTQKQTGKMAN